MAENRTPDVDELVIVIPGNPDAKLSLNGRAHPMAKARLVKAWRRTAYYAALDALGFPPDEPVYQGPTTVQSTIYWAKGRQKVDGDNAHGLLKAAIDGLVDARVFNDRDCVFLPVEQMRDPYQTGFVKIVVRAAEGASQ